jgi:pyroglutamyl-peptidase
MNIQTVLLTGFAPFDKEPINSSWEVARALNLTTMTLPRSSFIGSKGARQAKVVARQLPCEFDRALDVLAGLIKRLKPDLILGKH